jgi:hypothetical protein
LWQGYLLDEPLLQEEIMKLIKLTLHATVAIITLLSFSPTATSVAFGDVRVPSGDMKLEGGDLLISGTAKGIVFPDSSMQTTAAPANLKTILNGPGKPDVVNGVDGDFYIDTKSSTIYGPKNLGAWPATGVSLVGPTGATGPIGPVGPGGVEATAATPSSNFFGDVPWTTLGTLTLNPSTDGAYLVRVKGYLENQSEYNYITVWCKTSAQRTDILPPVTSFQLDFVEMRLFYIDQMGGVTVPQAVVLDGVVPVTAGSAWKVDFSCMADSTTRGIATSLKMSAILSTSQLPRQ